MSVRQRIEEQRQEEARLRHLFEGKVVERVKLDDLADWEEKHPGLVPTGSRWVGGQLVVEYSHIKGGANGT